MHLGKTILGGLIGAAVGIALLVGIYFAFKLDHARTAILLAICVGMGVRTLVSTQGHASYVRGAVTMMLAIVAFVGAKFIVAQAATMRAAAQPTTAQLLAERRQAAGPVIAEEGVVTDGAEMVEIAAQEAQSAPVGPSMPPLNRPREFSTWDFVWVCVAGLVAYELGRGAGVPKPESADATAAGPGATAAT